MTPRTTIALACALLATRSAGASPNDPLAHASADVDGDGKADDIHVFADGRVEFSPAGAAPKSLSLGGKIVSARIQIARGAKLGGRPEGSVALGGWTGEQQSELSCGRLSLPAHVRL